jgi:molybdopterin-guanine dinucleotide biosynthesis protein A
MTTNKKNNQPYIKIHLPHSLKEQLQHLAQQRSISLSSLMRLIATEYIKNKG